jgi:hypothetical protein
VRRREEGERGERGGGRERREERWARRNEGGETSEMVHDEWGSRTALPLTSLFNTLFMIYSS